LKSIMNLSNPIYSLPLTKIFWHFLIIYNHPTLVKSGAEEFS
jgi:hypothetical protein